MGTKEKLITKLLSAPKDFTYNEAVTLLKFFGFEVKNKSGSSRAFVHPETKQIIYFHEPHPEKILKRYIIKIIISKLKEYGYLQL